MNYDDLEDFYITTEMEDLYNDMVSDSMFDNMIVELDELDNRRSTDRLFIKGNPMNNTKKNLTGSQRERQLHQVAQKYLAGMTQQAIATELGITQQQVSYDMKQIRDSWIERTAFKLDEQRAETLARIELAESEAWKSFELSGKKDVKFLNILLKCIDHRCKLLHLYAPREEEKPPRISYEMLTNEELKTLIDVRDSKAELVYFN